MAELDHMIHSLHQVKAAREHLESLFAGGVGAISNAAKTLSHEAASYLPKKRDRVSRRLVKSGLLKEESELGRGRRKRNELGPARPGTLRAIVHEALKDLGPIKTNALVKHIEDKLGKDAGKSLRVRVNQVLINRRDPFIKKVSRGIYKHAT